MNAQRFHGTADGAELVIDRAADGAPLVNCRGWSCGSCEAVWVTRWEADRCCTEADRTGAADHPRTLRLQFYDPE